MRVSSSTPVSGCKIWFLMSRSYCTSDRQWFQPGMIVSCLLFLPSTTFLCNFMPLFWLMIVFSHWVATVLVASCCQNWWLIPACARCLFSWSLWHFLILEASWFWISNDSGHAYGFHRCIMFSIFVTLLGQCCAVGFSCGGGGGGEDVQLSVNNSSMLSSLTVFVMYARTEQAAVYLEIAADAI